MASPGLALARLVACVAVAVAIVSMRPAAPPRSPPVPRHLVLVSIDTLRADHLGCYGYDRPTSPWLDAFAAGGTRFERAVAHAPNTLPSHIALLTSRLAGTFPRTDGEAPLPESAVTLAEVLADHGFATWAFVDGGYLRRSFGLAQGFEHYEDRRVGMARLRERVARWLDENAAEDRRRFLFVHTYEVHSPYAPPLPYRQLFLDPDNPSRFAASTENLKAVVERTVRLGEGDLERIVGLYDAGIRYMDDQLASFFRDLEERGLLHDAAVVVTSDHGEEFMEHGSLLHWQIYFRPNLHVPLIVRVPGRSPRVVPDVVGLIDVVPTVLDLLGLPPLATAMGRSLLPLIDGAPAASAAVYSEPFRLDLENRSLVTPTHQLLRTARAPAPLLFDLRQDPFSRRNVRGAQPMVAGRLDAELAARRAAIDEARESERPVASGAHRISPRIRRELEALGYLE